MPRSVELCVGDCILSFWPGGAAWLRSLVGVGWRTTCVLKSRFRADSRIPGARCDRACLRGISGEGSVAISVAYSPRSTTRAARQSPVRGSEDTTCTALETGRIELYLKNVAAPSMAAREGTNMEFWTSYEHMYRLMLEMADALTFTLPHPLHTLYLCASRIAWRLLGGLAVRW